MRRPMTSEELILRGIAVSFGAVVALDSIDFDIPSRGIVALVGANGSGKSTLLDILSGFVRQSRGSIASPAPQRMLAPGDLVARVARLHQRLVVPPNIMAGEFLSVVATGHSPSALVSPASWAAAQEVSRGNASSDILHAADLGNSMHKRVSALSYGQQRALAIEAVLAARKPVVALDEPLAGLHHSTRDAVLGRIRGEARTRCVLIAEHDLMGALAVADRLIVLRLGQIVADLPPARVTIPDLVARF
jgi:ABC-type branched-subunit amino acid transport system ATPase component